MYPISKKKGFRKKSCGYQVNLSKSCKNVWDISRGNFHQTPDSVVYKSLVEVEKLKSLQLLELHRTILQMINRFLARILENLIT